MPRKEKEFRYRLRCLAEDIINYNPKRKQLTHDQAMKKFYSIMEKHGIKQGEWTEGGGRLVANFEWTLCLTMFHEVRRNEFLLQDLFSEGMPKNLLAYGKKPKTKKIPLNDDLFEGLS